MFYVSKWPELEIGNSFNIDKHRFLSTMTSFVHGRKGPEIFSADPSLGEPRTTGGGLLVQKGKCDLQLICLGPQGSLPGFLNHVHVCFSGRCALCPSTGSHPQPGAAFSSRLTSKPCSLPNLIDLPFPIHLQPDSFTLPGPS